jgi:hypothetical protein
MFGRTKEQYFNDVREKHTDLIILSNNQRIKNNNLFDSAYDIAYDPSVYPDDAAVEALQTSLRALLPGCSFQLHKGEVHQMQKISVSREPAMELLGLKTRFN